MLVCMGGGGGGVWCGGGSGGGGGDNDVCVCQALDWLFSRSVFF